MRTVVATRYVTPLREGGSLPALVEADDDGYYVVKFTGAGGQVTPAGGVDPSVGQFSSGWRGRKIAQRA